jgi:PAS domain S-box-containing protein
LPEIKTTVKISPGGSKNGNLFRENHLEGKNDLRPGNEAGNDRLAEWCFVAKTGGLGEGYLVNSNFGEQNGNKKMSVVSEKEIERVLGILPDGVVRLNKDGALRWHNQAFCKMLAIEDFSDDHKKMEDFFHPAHLGQNRENLLQILIRDDCSFQIELCLNGPADRPIWVLARAFPTVSTENSYFLQFIDISSWKEAEERFRVAFHTSPDSINLNRLKDGLYVATNEGFTEITGYTEEDVKGKTSLEWGIWENPADRERLLEMLNEEGMVKNFEARFRMKDGSIRWGLVSANIIMLQGEPHILSVVRDITAIKEFESERRSLEEQLQQAQKLEAIGLLASGISHDFNNILTAIGGFAELGRREAEKESEVAEYFEEIEKAGARAKDLVKQILAFSRQRDSGSTVVDPLQTVQEASRMLRATLPSNISIVNHLPPKCSHVLANASQLHQVILNLGANASHAMETSGGELTLAVREVMLSESDLKGTEEVQPGQFVCISVEDTGVGIEKPHLNRIFEPFFTTKSPEKGTGLGLSVVHGIIRKHGGTIKVESIVGRGSRFSLFLPVFSRPLPVEKEIGEANRVLEGSERLLIVDDEATIVKVLINFFTPLGYRVSGFTSSSEALAAFRADPFAFDLVITDQTMPGMLGADMAAAMLEIRPVPIILCSGHSTVMTQEIALSLGIKRYFQKPLALSFIAASVRELLDEEKSAAQQKDG